MSLLDSSFFGVYNASTFIFAPPNLLLSRKKKP